MTLQLLAKYKGKKTLFLLLFKAASQKEPTPLNEHLQRQWETCGPPRSTRSKRRVMFTFSRPHWGVGVKLNGGGLRNQWVDQGLLLDRGDPDLAVLLAATSARVCAHRCACVPLWCSQSSGACYFGNARRNLKMSRCFPKVHQIHAPACRKKIIKQEMLTRKYHKGRFEQTAARMFDKKNLAAWCRS